MDQQTINQLEQLMQKLLDKAMVNVATKDDLKNFATKNDLKNFATKDDLKNFATKDDLISLENRLEEKFATKDDLKQLKSDLIEEIKESEAFIVGSVDKHKADAAIVIELDKRVTRIERKLAI